MQFATGQFSPDCFVYTLLALDTVLAGKLGTDDQRSKMLPIAIEFEMFAGQAGEYELLDLIGVHEVSVSELPAALQEVKNKDGSKGKASGHYGQALYRRHI